MTDVKIKLLPGGQLPRRMTTGAAGWDCAANIQAPKRVYAETSAAVPLGFELEIPPGWLAHVAPRSGLAFNFDVIGYHGTIDSDYRGEVRALLFNHGGRAYDVKPGERVCQLIFRRVEEVRLVEADALGETERGKKGYGSTGKTALMTEQNVLISQGKICPHEVYDGVTDPCCPLCRRLVRERNK